jgi:pantothenate synthetase
MPNQYTVEGKESKGRKDGVGQELTVRQKRLFFNVASGRFKTVREAGIDAGYAMSSANTNCQALVREYADYIEELRQEFLAPSREQAQKDADMARRILKDLALSSANDQVKRLACRDLLELNGELKTIKPDKTEDLTPRDLRAEAQRVAKELSRDTTPSTVN